MAGSNVRSRFQVVDSSYDGRADQAPALDREDGSSFGWYERMFLSWRDGKVFDYSDWHARDIEEALGKDYKMKQLERVLCGPIEAAEHTIDGIKGDKGEADWTQAFLTADEFSGGMCTPIELIQSQMTSAFGYRKAFFELVWTTGIGDFAGKTVLKKCAYRPATTCRMVRDPQTGESLGFEQEPFYMGVEFQKTRRDSKGIYPIEIPTNRAFIYVHGMRRDPVNGVSDLDVAYWAYKTKQKILFLWFQFAERASLPKVNVIAQDEGTATSIAQQIARTVATGVTPIAAPNGPQSVQIQTMDISGKGGEQFQHIIAWLDQAAANSCMAGFTQLTDYQKNGGSYALSNDASDFFLQTREADSREMAREIRRGLIAPLVRYNFGPQAKIPKFNFEPLNTEDKSQQVTMLTDLMRSRDPALVPDEFIGQLSQQVAEYLGMDGDKIRAAFDDSAKKAKAAAAAAGVNTAGQQVAGVAGAVSKAASTVAKVSGINAPVKQLPTAY